MSAAKPHLQRVAAPGLRLGLVKAIAEIVDMTPSEVERLCELKAQASVLRGAPRRAARAAITPLDEHLLRLLVRDGSLARLPAVADHRYAIPPDSPVLDVIDAICAAPVLPKAAALAAAFAGTPVEPLLRRALVEELEFEKDAEIVRAEFGHALQTLLAQWRSRRKEELIARMVEDPSARAEFAALLAEESDTRALPAVA